MFGLGISKSTGLKYTAKSPYWESDPNHEMNDWMYMQEFEITYEFNDDLDEFREYIQSNVAIDSEHIFANSKADGSDVAICIDGRNQIERRITRWNTSTKKFKIAILPNRTQAGPNKGQIYYGNPSANIPNTLTMPSKWLVDYDKSTGVDLCDNEVYKNSQWILADNSHSGARYNGKVYIVYFERNRYLYARVYDELTATWSDASLITSGATYLDIETGHGVPDIEIINSGADQGKIVAVWTDGVKIYSIKSTNSEDITSWDSVVEVYDGGSDEPNKPLLAQASNSDLIIITDQKPSASIAFRDTLVFTSTDDAENWSGGLLFSVDTNEYIQHAIHMDSDDILHVAVEHQVTQSPFRCAVYYMKTDDLGSTWKKRDGTTITPAIANMDLIYDPGSGYSARCPEIIDDGNNNPMFILHESDTSTYSDTYCSRWSGSNWTLELVGETSLLTTPRQSCGGCFSPIDSDYVYVSQSEGSNIKVFHYDSGSWSEDSTVISKSTGKFFRPNRIKNASSDFEILCAYSNAFVSGDEWGICQVIAVPLQLDTPLTFNSHGDYKIDDNTTWEWPDDTYLDVAVPFTQKDHWKKITNAADDLTNKRNSIASAANGWGIGFQSGGALRITGIEDASNKVQKTTVTTYNDSLWHYSGAIFTDNKDTCKIRLDSIDPSVTDASDAGYNAITSNNYPYTFGKRDGNSPPGFVGYSTIASLVSIAESDDVLDAEYNNAFPDTWCSVPNGVQTRGQ